VHIPPGGLGFLRDAFSREGLAVMGRITLIYVFVAMFWSLYEQTGSAWVLQAAKMDLNVFGWELKASQTHSANPILILLFIPLFSYGIYPAINRFFPLTPLRKIGIGFLLTSAAFCVTAIIETWIVAGDKPHIGWQMIAYVIMTAGEVMVSITGLEFSYTQAPLKMKSIVMALFLLSNSAGNLFTAMVNYFLQDEAGNLRLSGPDYYWFFAGLMAATAVVYVFVAMNYRGRTYIQGDAAGEVA
jgi:POT family proton-dependent oligopeptide transporter